jgi:UDP-N-acetylglucosamine 2-epimerase
MVATANRSERGLLEPLISTLEKRDDIDFKLVGPGVDFRTTDSPDVILIPGDRTEMVHLAVKCYYARIPVFHLYAGVGGTGTIDDLNRRVISSFSYSAKTKLQNCG